MAVVGVVVAVAALAFGCGGDDDDSLTKAEYRKQANALCLQGNDQKDNAIREGFEDPKKAGITAKGEAGTIEVLTELALPPIVAMTEELKELGGPEGEEEKAEEMVEAIEAEIDEIEANPKAVATGSGGEFNEANKLADELGLESCAKV